MNMEYILASIFKIFFNILLLSFYTPIFNNPAQEETRAHYA